MPDLQTARQAYINSPGSLGGGYSDQTFVDWWNKNGSQVDITQYPQDFDLLQALADNGDQGAANALGALGYEPVNAGAGGGAPGGQGFNSQLYLKYRPDLQANWSNAQDPAKRASDPTAAAIYSNYKSIDDYLQADYNSNGGAQKYPDVLTTPAAGGGAGGGALTPVATETLPAEQGILQQFLPKVTQSIQDDTGRADLARTLQGNAIQDYNTTRDLLNQSLSGDRLQQEYQQAEKTGTALTDAAKTAATTQQGALTKSTQDQGAALNTEVSAKLASLNESIGTMQSNLTGELAARAAALRQQIETLSSNLNTLDASQRQILAKQIADQQQNLEQSITTQRGALTTQIAQLRGAADAQSQARAAALQQEIDGLTAAQAPMAEARLKSAEALNTAVNLGLESTKDQLTADQALAGYFGGSTMQDAALARATIGARQQGAQAIGGAREANAADTRTIQSRSATEGRTIADELARNQASITGMDAQGGLDLSKQLAEGTRGVADYGANSAAAIGANTAEGLRGIGDQGATQTYSDLLYGASGAKTLADQQAQQMQGIQDYGSSGTRSLADALASGTYDISTNLAGQAQDAANKTAAAKQNYFDNDYLRALQNAFQLPSLTNNLASTTTNLATVPNSGLKDSLSILNWWANGGQAPTGGFIPLQPSQSGSDLAGLGTGILGAGLNWLTPAKTATTTTPTTVPKIATDPNKLLDAPVGFGTQNANTA